MPLERKEAEKIIRKKHFAEQKQLREIEEDNIERKKNAKKILPFIVNGSYLSEEEIVQKTGITIGKVRQALPRLRFYSEIKVAEKKWNRILWKIGGGKMPLSKEEVEEIGQKKKEEKEKVIEFFEQQEKGGKKDFFNSQEVSQETGISVKAAGNILEAIHTKTLAEPIVFIDKGQTKTMRLLKTEKKEIFYYGARFYKQKKIPQIRKAD